MRLDHSMAGLAIVLAMTVSGSAWAACAGGVAGKPVAKGQAVERVATPISCAHGDIGAGGLVANTADLGRLPPIDSIEARTDIRQFLAASVPTDVQVAALRRVWSADPSIRDFVGLSEDMSAADALASSTGSPRM